MSISITSGTRDQSTGTHEMHTTMKKAAVFIVLMSLGLALPAQKRTLIPNGDFETAPGGEPGGWSIGSGMHITAPGTEDSAIRGEYALHIDGKAVKSNSLLLCDHAFAVAKNEIYQLKFKAFCTGSEEAVITPYLECQYGSGHFPGENLFDNRQVTIPCDGQVREYVLNAEPLEGFGTGNMVCSYTVFLINFLQMQGRDSYLTIDDIQVIRTDRFGEALGNIKTNPEFTDLFTTYWLYTERGHTLSNATEGGRNYAKIDLIPGKIVPPKTGYSCFTGSCAFWKEHENRNWEIRVTLEADFAAPDAKFFINGDEKVFKYLVPRESITGLTGTGGFTFELKEGLHTYTFDYLAKDKGGAFHTGYKSGDLLFDLNFGTAEEGTVWVHSFYVVEKQEVTGLSIDMPGKVEIGQSVPVTIWANPTHADNQVELSVSNGNGAVELDETGVWQYTQLSPGECILTAVSKENVSVQATKSVEEESLTSVRYIATDGIEIYVNRVSGLLVLEGLDGGETLELIHPAGNIVRTVRSQSVISIAGLERGVYFLRISKDGQFVVSKFLN